MIQDESDHGFINGIGESLPVVDSSVPLMHLDPSHHGSLILIWIAQKEPTLNDFTVLRIIVVTELSTLKLANKSAVDRSRHIH